MKFTKRFKQLAALLLAVVVMAGGFAMPADAAAAEAVEGGNITTLEFYVKDMNGNPVKGVQFKLYESGYPSTLSGSPVSNAMGRVRWNAPGYSDAPETCFGTDLEFKPVKPNGEFYKCDKPVTFQLAKEGYDVVISTINGVPANEASVVEVNLKEAVAAQGHTTLKLKVVDQAGVMFTGCKFVVKASYDDTPDGIYAGTTPNWISGIANMKIDDPNMTEGVVRLVQKDQEKYDAKPIAITAKNKCFVTVDGKPYNGETITVVVTEKGAVAPEVNKKPLEEAIAEATKKVTLESSKYTPESVEKLDAAITEAEKVLNKVDVKQEELDQAEKTLKAEIGKLVLKPQLNKDALTNAIAKAEAEVKKTDIYTPNSIEKVTAQIEVAKKVLAEAKTQDELNKAVADLEAVKLVKQADKKDLNALIKNFTENAPKEENFTKESMFNYKKALRAANVVNNNKNATQDEVDKACKDLKDAKESLVSIYEIKETIKLVNDNHKKDDYTADSWKALDDAIKAAEVVLAKENATQEEVDAAVTAIKNAEKALVKDEQTEQPEQPVEVDKAKLVELLNKAKAFKKGDYTEKSWKSLQDAIKAADAVMEDKDANQEAVDAQIKALTEAVNGLVKAEGKVPTTGDSAPVVTYVSVMLCAAVVVLALRKKVAYR